MNREELSEILRLHKRYLNNEEGGKRADLYGANLYGANLYGADLSRANLSGADLSRADLSRANLSRANLYGANLYGANLSRADLSRANLYEANLYEANLYAANLRGANLDFSSGIPFHCGGTGVKGDERLFAQIVYHLTRQDWSSLSDDDREWLNNIPEDIKNRFCNFRNDVGKI